MISSECLRKEAVQFESLFSMVCMLVLAGVLKMLYSAIGQEGQNSCSKPHAVISIPHKVN